MHSRYRRYTPPFLGRMDAYNLMRCQRSNEELELTYEMSSISPPSKRVRTRSPPPHVADRTNFDSRSGADGCLNLPCWTIPWPPEPPDIRGVCRLLACYGDCSPSALHKTGTRPNCQSIFRGILLEKKKISEGDNLMIW